MVTTPAARFESGQIEFKNMLLEHKLNKNYTQKTASNT